MLRIFKKSNYEKIYRTVYAWGTPCDKIYGYMVLRKNGEVYGYNHPNEAKFEFKDGFLFFYHKDGFLTSVLKYYPELNLFHGNLYEKKFPVFLYPIVTLDDRKDSGFEYPPILINSIPKSGTYFLEKALSLIGYRSHRLHLSGYNIIDDYRGLSDDEMHRDPEKVRVFAPVYLITALLEKGELVVGHVDDLESLREIVRQGVLIIFLIRNLRNVLVSLYRFKLTKVYPTYIVPLDYYWRRISCEKTKFKLFLTTYYSFGIQHIKLLAEVFLNLKEEAGVTYLSFEMLETQSINQDIKEKLNSIHPELADLIEEGLKKSFMQQTSTFSGRISKWEEYWDEEVEDFFEISGLKDLNKKLGYE